VVGIVNGAVVIAVVCHIGAKFIGSSFFGVANQ